MKNLFFYSLLLFSQYALAQTYVAPILRNQSSVAVPASGDTAALNDIQRKHPFDFEYTAGVLVKDKGYASEKRVPVRLDVLVQGQHLDGFKLRVSVFKATESRPRPADFNNLRSDEWTNYGTVNTDMNPFWIQLPQGHFYHFVVHSENDFTDKFYQISGPANLRFNLSAP